MCRTAALHPFALHPTVYGTQLKLQGLNCAVCPGSSQAIKALKSLQTQQASDSGGDAAGQWLSWQHMPECRSAGRTTGTGPGTNGPRPRRKLSLVFRIQFFTVARSLAALSSWKGPIGRTAAIIARPLCWQIPKPNKRSCSV